MLITTETTTLIGKGIRFGSDSIHLEKCSIPQRTQAATRNIPHSSSVAYTPTLRITEATNVMISVSATIKVPRIKFRFVIHGAIIETRNSRLSIF